MQGKFVPLKETISGFKAILEGKYDHLPEAAFYMVGAIEEVEVKARTLAVSDSKTEDKKDKEKEKPKKKEQEPDGLKPDFAQSSPTDKMKWFEAWMTDKLKRGRHIEMKPFKPVSSLSDTESREVKDEYDKAAKLFQTMKEQVEANLKKQPAA